jgi:hypothetical protein
MNYYHIILIGLIIEEFLLRIIPSLFFFKTVKNCFYLSLIYLFYLYYINDQNIIINLCFNIFYNFLNLKNSNFQIISFRFLIIILCNC